MYIIYIYILIIYIDGYHLCRDTPQTKINHLFFCDQWIPSPWEDDICWDASAWLYLSTALRPSWRATCEPLLRDPVGEAKKRHDDM